MLFAWTGSWESTAAPISVLSPALSIRPEVCGYGRRAGFFRIAFTGAVRECGFSSGVTVC